MIGFLGFCFFDYWICLIGMFGFWNFFVLGLLGCLSFWIFGFLGIWIFGMFEFLDSSGDAWP